MKNITAKMSSKIFRTLSMVSDVIFFLSMVVIISYTTFVTETMTWDMAIFIAFSIISYSINFFKKPKFGNIFKEDDA
ncbi:hypothetical protein [Alteribacillus iranensis]|uniref:Uncharacterized protein n=1 Tax=Alteribacillus iranensis TaxID=930128 RepID=A0A1I2F3E7_9BACI|nr:hypothetical protein [Alteribacillus iranensis]SFE99367.1 hypothetical protein SAMN05192532_10863 [Alteribacillus iranensis]